MTTPTTVPVRLKLRQGTAANWTSVNPTLLAGELGRESDTGKIKIGNGSSTWTALAYQAWATLPVAVSAGGTGQTTYTNGQLLIGNTTGNTLTKATLTAGSGVAITNGTGSITVAASNIANAQISASAAIVDTKLATIATAGKVSNSATTATSANTASAIVARDASGNFSAGTITAALTGNADTASKLNSTRTFAVTGDITGTVSSDLTAGASIATSIASGVIVDADVNASAAIAGTKISPNFGSQNVVTTGTNTAASLIPTGSTVPTNGVYLPAANTLGVATNGTERLRITSAGALLVGTTATPTGAGSGAVVAQDRMVISSSGAGRNQVIVGDVGTVTAATGTAVFKFKSTDAATGRAAYVKLSISQRANNSTPSNLPVAEYAFQLHNTGAGVCSLNGATTICEYTYVRATHFTFADLGSGECTVTLTNPTGIALSGSYKVEILTQGGIWTLDSVTTT
jgi:hypothetical protein